jgi:FkbM family methyltransferase
VKVKDLFVAKLPDIVYVILKNRQFRFQKSSVRYVSRNGMIEIKDANLLWITHRNRAHLYSRGLLERGASIGKSYLLDNIEFAEGDTVVDCGANMGDLQLWFKNKRIQVNYLGIEPNPLDFDCLSKNMLTGSSCLNLALWKESGSLKFWIDSKSASSSLIEPPNFSKTTTVKASRLDELQMPERIKLLKVEGEGAEPEILFGAVDFLSRIEFISVDVGPERGIEQATTRSEVFNFLQDNHFKLILENPYHRKTALFTNSRLKPLETVG